MLRLPKCCGLGIMVLALLVGAGVSQDAKKDEKKAKGFLPAGFKDLGLSATQKEKIYGVMSEFKSKITVLDKQIKELKKAEQQEIFQVLTDDQKEKYLKAKGVDKKSDKKSTLDKTTKSTLEKSSK